MSDISNYTFFNMARVGEDEGCIDQRDVQNTMACNYSLYNNFSKDCTMRETRFVATSQPGVNFSGTKQLCPGGSNIIENTKLTYDNASVRSKCKLDLFSRPYVTVPCLKRGYGNVIVESELQQGEQVNSKKIHNDTDNPNISTTETNYSDYNMRTLIPSKRRVVQNPNNLVEESASEKWIRGGVSSRDMSKDTNKYVSYE